jgi:hypothetical protein
MTTTDSFESLWAFCTANDRVVPKHWDKFYKRLSNTRQLPSGGWEPALPLILAAWHETTPIEKQLRFKEQIEWANIQGQIEEIGIYLRHLGEHDWYHFGEL